jgi:alpha-1,2-mannosyltransferase
MVFTPLRHPVLSIVWSAQMGEFVRRLVPALKSGDWLDRRRIAADAAILLGFEILAFLLLTAYAHGLIVPLDKPEAADFVSFYAAGSLADQGSAPAAYDIVRHMAAEEAATEHGIDYMLFAYPPVFMLICAVLARLPYVAAFSLFEGVTLVPCLQVAKAILQEKGWRAFVPLLAFPAVAITVGVGQNALLTAALFGGATLLIDRRPVVAGLMFGALCYKPHFGLLIPVALIAAGRWRAVAGAAVSAMALVGLSAAVFGIEAWRAFIVAFTGSRVLYEAGKVDFAAFVSSFGAVRLMGGGPALAYAVQGVAALSAAALVAIVWRRGLSLPVRAATLAAATLVALPLILFYDLMMAGVAMAWLVRAGKQGGFLPYEKSLLLAVFLTPLLTRAAGNSLHMPIGVLAGYVLLALCAARTWRELGATWPVHSQAVSEAITPPLLPLVHPRPTIMLLSPEKCTHQAGSVDAQSLSPVAAGI